MLFGLCNAPTTFERPMERVLTHVPDCLDDLLIHASDFKGALCSLWEVFAAICQAGLRLNPKKCQLFRRKTAFLGHVVSAGGVSTNPAKIAAVRDWPLPINVSNLQSFLGLASYYHFATIASPLHRLTNHGRPYVWDDPCSTAFKILQIIMAPVLAYPDVNRSCIINTDASNVGVGAVLSQQGDSGEQEEQERDATLAHVRSWLAAGRRLEWEDVALDPNGVASRCEAVCCTGGGGP
ncbi:hypothetical protein AAFF_G00337850 [Aldrovandia affinis]|uniref:ribonuclease H n=1 Tax=Aldrovandia affinis TaxID=143900 RepID=A0AAD7WPS4_9TELE|nr:hypothetical protein AAFF_G00337850 [Aldrovandia affinis]